MKRYIVNFLVIFFCSILIINFIRSVSLSTPLTFESFIRLLQTSPRVNFIKVLEVAEIGGNWGVFEFLRSFLNSFVYLLNLSVWLANNIVNALLFILHILNIVFSF